MNPKHYAAAAFAASLLSIGSGRASELSKLLELHPSPASIALLAPFSREASVQDRWKQALADKDPRVRGVAARAIATCNVPSLLADIEHALASETDDDAALEEARAVILIGGPEKDDLVLSAAARFGCSLYPVIAGTMARARGPAAFPVYFASLRQACLSSHDREVFFRLATREGKEGAEGAASMALGRLDAVTWKAVLAAAPKTGSLPGSPVIEKALASPVGSVRSETAWYLARAYCEGSPSDSGKLIESLNAGESADTTFGADPESAFGEELLKRVLGDAPKESAAWIACLRTNPECHLDSDLVKSPLLKFLTNSERDAIEERNHKNLPPELKNAPPSKVEAAAVGPDAGKESRLWALTGMPRGLGEDLLQVASCGGHGRGQIGLARIAYRRDGRPNAVELMAVPAITGCEEILKAAYLLSLAPGALSADDQEPIVVETVLLPEVLAATGGRSADSSKRPPSEAGRPPYRIRGNVVAPKLDRRVEPGYPTTARNEHHEGLTVLEAIIGEDGAIHSLHVIRSSFFLLDAASMAAVSQWRYKPASLDGVPVTVYLTVTVNFQLHR
jgi:TonB family protein